MKVLMAAGGTGGHVMPALSIAKAIRAIDSQAEILFVGTPQGMENDLLVGTGFSMETITLKGLKRKGLVEKIRNLAYLPHAFWRSWRILRRFAPEAVFGIGGYASGPILFLASLIGPKTAILEPNVVPGFANRLLARFVNRIFVAFDESLARLPSSKCLISGNPIREEILQISPPALQGKRMGILVFGGSQGARQINEAVMDMLPQISMANRPWFFVHQTGEHDLDRVQNAYREHGIEAEVKPFFSDMAHAYRQCDLVVARSGSSVLEIAACGRPAILVPYPYAADDHQHSNAEVVKKAGGAVILENDALNGKILFETLSKLISDPDRLQEMSRAALTLRKDQAAATIALELSRWSVRAAA